MSQNREHLEQTCSLCEVCQKIEFGRYLRYRIKAALLLGSWKDVVRRRKCPFCRLVTHCLRSRSRLTPYYPATEVFLENAPSWELGIELSPYEYSKSLSYSNRFDLWSCQKRKEDTVYRFLVVTHENNVRKTGYIQHLADTESSTRWGQFRGRKISQAAVDINLLRSWFRRCRRWHAGECDRTGVAGVTLPRNIRLIDVHKKCIIRASEVENLEYVALSYVWGTKTMKANTGMDPSVLRKADIRRVDGKEKTPLSTKLPRTIQDAIELVRDMGFRYLWCDALCIVQDDSETRKANHLARMDAIYNRAVLTIAAAAGSHADCGLPGIGVPRQVPQYFEDVMQLRFATMSDSYSELENSRALPWNTRGWTFQEKVLSKRILLFTNYQVYFKCSEAIWTEEICMETERLSKSVEARRGKYRWAPDRPLHVPSKRAALWSEFNPELNTDDGFRHNKGFLDYISAVHEYTTRSLTDPRDAAFAAGGVLKTMIPSVGPFIHALPEEHILESLMWYPEANTVLIPVERTARPSWSWLSWSFSRKWACYEITDDTAFDDLAEYFTVADLAFENLQNMRRPSVGDFSVLLLLMFLFQLPLTLRGHTLKQVWYRRGRICRPLAFSAPMNFLVDGQIGRYAKYMRHYWPLWIKQTSWRCKKLWFLILTGLKRTTAAVKEEIESRLFDWSPSKRSMSGERPALIFKTVIVSFWIGKQLAGVRPKDYQEIAPFELLNAQGECVGEIWTAWSTVKNMKGRSGRFLSISWSLSLQWAKPSAAWRPTFDGYKGLMTGTESLPQSRSITSSALRSGWTRNIDKISQQVWSVSLTDLWKSGSRSQSRSSGVDLYTSILRINQGDSLPRALWLVVNVILVHGDGSEVSRCGSGKVLMTAWKAAQTTPQEVVFV